MTDIVRHYGGSWSYGTYVEGVSDIDIRGIYVAEEKQIRTPFFPSKEKSIDGENDAVLYELSKYMTMCLANNPNAIESLWVNKSDLIMTTENYWKLRNNRENFLSKKIISSFSGYALSQLKKMKSRDK